MAEPTGDKQELRARGLQRLRLDLFAKDAIAALEQRSVRAMLLKGLSFERLLYEPREVRTQMDIDVLIDPSRKIDAEAALETMGYEVPVFARNAAGGRSSLSLRHAAVWEHKEGVTLDLHVFILGIGVPPDQAFERFWEDRDHVDLGWGRIPVLGLPAQAMHVALHSAQHAGDSAHAADDLARACDRIPLSIWLVAYQQARELGAVGPFGLGLRCCSKGATLADRMNVPAAVSSETLLIASGAAPTGAIILDRLLRTPGIVAKGRLAWRELFPRRNILETLHGQPLSKRDAWHAHLVRSARVPGMGLRAVAAVRLARRESTRRSEGVESPTRRRFGRLRRRPDKRSP